MSLLARASALLMGCFLLYPLNAAAFDRGEVEKFATLPNGFGNPEGITTDSHGNVYVSTCMPTGAPPGQLFVFSRHGHLLRQVSVQGSSNLLLGLDFHPDNHALLVIDFGNAQVLKVNPFSGESTIFAAIPGGGPNALTFDKQGNVYVSDSGQGIIWRIAPFGGIAESWVNSPLLRTSGVPPRSARTASRSTSTEVRCSSRIRAMIA